MKRGEVWLTSLDPVQGSEQAGVRPVLVVQNDDLNSFLRTCMVVPFTTNLRWEAMPFCVRVAQGDGGLRNDSVALCQQARVLDRSRLRERWGKVNAETLAKIDLALQIVLSQ